MSRSRTSGSGRLPPATSCPRAAAETYNAWLRLPGAAFGDARADACAAAAWLDVAAGREAEQRAQRALDHLSALPRPRQPFSQVAGAQLDIASARLLTGNLDGAGAMLSGVLELPDRMRNVSLAGRMARIRDELHAMNDDGEVRRLLATVEVWLREADAIRAQEVSRLPR